jgi:hypothetical protein
MTRRYQYVGPVALRERTAGHPAGTAIGSAADLTDWLRERRHEVGADGTIAAAFVIDERGVLRLADRRSEHVACAGGGPVLSAGEMFFAMTADRVEVAAVTNQSTGYCPEPESWPAVATALDHIGVAHSGRFMQEIVFRRCIVCGERNVVKDGWYVCGSCGADLPAEWNFRHTDTPG